MPPAPSSTNTSLPGTVQTPTPTLVPTPTIHPQVQQSLAGSEAFLPSEGQPLYHLAWTSSASDGYWGGVYLPYRMPGGASLLVLGQPRQEDNSWNGEDQVFIWDWQNSGLEPALWQEIRPVGRNQSSFFGQDQEGHWWAVMGKIDWELPEYVVLGMFPVPSLDTIPVEKIGKNPIEELDDLQIERVGLFSEEENASGVDYYLLRENNSMILYQMESGQARDVWSTDRVMQGRFHVHSPADHEGSVDMTGDGREEILIVWDLQFPSMIDVYEFDDDRSDTLRWLGRFDSTWQYTDVNGDAVPEFLYPDDPENPEAWQVIGWDGNAFVQEEPLLYPQQVSPPPASITRLEHLPPLPSNLLFQSRNDFHWWRLPGPGGSPEKIRDFPIHSYETCFPTYSLDCYSPAGRFKVVSITPYIEGASAGILDGITGERVTVPDSFVYTVGFNTYAWSPDEAFLLFALGDGIARLSKVDPVSGESKIVWNSSLCGLDIWDCTQYGGALALTDPVVFEDGSFAFAFQSAYPSLFPPPGIYHLSSQGELSMLAALPFIDESKGSLNGHDSSLLYGRLVWSPDKSAFVFYDLLIGDKTGVRTLLLGKSDGSALWDLRGALPDVNQVFWEK